MRGNRHIDECRDEPVRAGSQGVLFSPPARRRPSNRHIDAEIVDARFLPPISSPVAAPAWLGGQGALSALTGRRDIPDRDDNNRHM